MVNNISRETAVEAIGILKRGGMNKVGERKLGLVLEYLIQETDSLKNSEKEEVPVKRHPGRQEKGDKN